MADESPPERPPIEYPPPPEPPDDGGGDSGGSSGNDIHVTSGSRTLLSVNQAGHTALYRMTGSFTGNPVGDSIRRRIHGYNNGAVEDTTANGTTTASSSSWDSSNNGQDDITCEADNALYSWRARVLDFTTGENINGGTLYFKSAAITATASTPTSSSVTSSGADITCLFFPNTFHSDVTVWLEYKKTSDPTWTQAGASANTYSYTQRTITRVLTGLAPSTQYQFRLQMTRTTINATTLTSATGSFTTLAGEPDVATNASSSVAATSAQLNGTLTINSGTGVQVYFVWDTVDPPVANSTTPQAKSASGVFNASITGLSESTLYYFKAVVTFTSPSGSPNEGDVQSFTTPGNPLADAIEEDHVDTLTVLGKYGVAKTITFTLRQPSTSSSDLLYTGTAPVQADVLVFQDGVFDDTSDNAPAQVGSTQIYTLVVSAAEMTNAGITDIVIHDASGTDFRDLHIRIITVIEVTNMILDPVTGSKADTTGLLVKGFGAGHGASFVAGATGKDVDGIIGEHFLRVGTIATGGATPTLDSGAVATTDYYTGCLFSIIGGTGIGQSRVITGYTSGRVVTPNKAFSVNPDATTVYALTAGPETWNVPAVSSELAAVPSVTGVAGALLALLFERFTFKIDQSATVQQWYKANSSTVWASRSVDDTGTLQTLGKLT